MARFSHRSLLQALGITDEEIKKSFICVVKAADEIIARHLKLEEEIKKGLNELKLPYSKVKSDYLKYYNNFVEPADKRCRKKRLKFLVLMNKKI